MQETWRPRLGAGMGYGDPGQGYGGPEWGYGVWGGTNSKSAPSSNLVESLNRTPTLESQS